MSTRLGKYVLRRKLGAGGMGEVWEATDTVLDRPVAVKLLSAEHDPEESIREAAAAARVNHPNAVAVYDAAEADGRWFIVMELVLGASAAQVLAERGRLPWAEATRIARDSAAGLTAVHAAGLVHRDIKPGNLLLTADGTAKIADFGIARRATKNTLTRTYQAVGTPHFMSPEQCWNEVADGRADVYSLGATYYTLLTGRPPYDGGSEMAVMYAHCNHPVPDPRAVVPDLPDGCAGVVRRAMAKQPADRYPTADGLRAALDALLVGTPPVERDDTRPFVGLPPRTVGLPPTPPARPTRRAALLLIPAAVVGASAAAFALYRATRTPPPSPNSGPAPEPPADTPTWAGSMLLPGQVMHLVVSPDGSTAAAGVTGHGDDGAKDGVYLFGHDGQAVAGWPKLGRGSEGVAYSPDGKRLAAAYRMWQRVRVWNLESGREETLGGPTNFPGACVVAFSPDGTRLAAGSYDAANVVWQRDGTGGWKRERELPRTPESQVWGFAFVPGTNRLMVMTAEGDRADARAALHVFDTTNGERVPGPPVAVKREWVGPTVAAAANAPRVAVTTLGELHLFDLPDWKPVGRPIRLTDGDRLQDVWTAALSADGTLCATATNGITRVWSAADGTAVRVIDRVTRVTAVAFTPDGKAILTGGEDGWVSASAVSAPPDGGTP